jgi:hypothetical protein
VIAFLLVVTCLLLSIPPFKAWIVENDPSIENLDILPSRPLWGQVSGRVIFGVQLMKPRADNIGGVSGEGALKGRAVNVELPETIDDLNLTPTVVLVGTIGFSNIC